MSTTIITELPAHIEAALPSIRDEWLKKGLATGPCDRTACEASLALAYEAAGLKKPKIVIWLRSPMEGAIGVAILLASGGMDLARDQVREQVREQVWDQVREQVRVQVWDQVWGQVGEQVRDQVGEQVREQVRDQVWVQVGEQIREQVRNQIRGQVWDQVREQTKGLADLACHGQHDAWWLSLYGVFRGLLPCVDRLAGLIGMAECGWWWPLDGAAVLTERPSVLRRDDRNRLHCETGPAIEYTDGFAVFSWHGTRIPREWIMDRASLDPATALNWPNVEQRRCAAEIIGWARILEHVGATVIDQDADPMIGTLLSCDIPGSPGARFLRVRCGTGRDFCIPVPQEMKSALQANAWTYGDEDDLNNFRAYHART